MIILGINAYHADASAAIFVDGKMIAAIEEERFRRVKHWAGFPQLAIEFCLKEAGIGVKLIGTGSKETYGSKEGYPAKVDASIEKVNAADFDGVVIPGGFAPDFLRRYPAVINFIKRLYSEGKAVAAICHGGWLLVSAGICRNNRLTCFYAIKDDLIAAGGKYVDAEVVVDRNLITSRKPEDLPRFVQELIKFVENN